jgi:hypothetical protein
MNMVGNIKDEVDIGGHHFHHPQLHAMLELVRSARVELLQRKLFQLRTRFREMGDVEPVPLTDEQVIIEALHRELRWHTNALEQMKKGEHID